MDVSEGNRQGMLSEGMNVREKEHQREEQKRDIDRGE